MDKLETRELGFEGLIELFGQTQTAMQTQAARSVDIALVARNWLFGWYIVEFEDGGAERADLYGKKLLKRLSEQLTRKLGKGFSQRSIQQFRNFYLSYKEILQTLSAKSLEQSKDIDQAAPDQSMPSENSRKISPEKIMQAVPAKSLNPERIQQTAAAESAENKIAQALPAQSFQSINQPEILKAIVEGLTSRFILGWTHYVTLLTVKNAEERRFYELEAAENCWGYRELERQINSSLYERLALSRDKEEVKKLSMRGQIVEKPSDVIKSPYILEFTGLEERKSYSEHDLETALIDKIEIFLMELGKGFLFEARQKRFSLDNRHFYVDLVLYNRLLRSYVLIDLKIGDLKHQDLGQMQMYVNYFDRHVKLDVEKPTVGILLCHSKNDELVELTLPEDSNIYASEYQLYLPSREELKKQLEEAREEWERQSAIRSGGKTE